MIKSIATLTLIIMFSLGQTARPSIAADNMSSLKRAKPDGLTELCWSGKINKKIPVFLHYSVNDNLIVGEITYLNSISKKPIKILGTVENDKSYRVLEFESGGNITGVIYGKPGQQTFDGSWFSPKTRKEVSLHLEKKDTSIVTQTIEPNLDEISGKYHYQYAKEGSSGDFSISKIKNNKAGFSIVSVTDGPALNTAEVSDDTIQLKGNSFIYKIPDADDCDFEVKFYKDFLTVKYIKGPCVGQFGMNATVEGIFLKVRP
jgi:hypothetical protein